MPSATCATSSRAAAGKAWGREARLEALVRAYLDPLWSTRSIHHEGSARR